MRPKQRETVQVVFHGTHGDSPALNRMAILAGRAELAAVDIRVTIRALFANLAKDFAYMALAASHVLMHSTQRKLGLRVVVELRLGANRLPAQGRVAALACRFERSVWIRGSLGRGPLCAQESQASEKQKRQ